MVAPPPPPPPVAPVQPSGGPAAGGDPTLAGLVVALSVLLFIAAFTAYMVWGAF